MIESFRPHLRSQPRRRSGTVIVLVIAFLILVMAMGSIGMRRLLQEREWRELQTTHDRRETLVEAAIQRFEALRKSDPQWVGDRWEVNVPPGTTYIVEAKPFAVQDTNRPTHRVQVLLKDRSNGDVLYEQWFEGPK